MYNFFFFCDYYLYFFDSSIIQIEYDSKLTNRRLE